MAVEIINTRKRQLIELNWALIERQMKKKHFTQISLAKEMGISRATISGWKSNLYTPTDERLDELCRILDIDDSEIFVPLVDAAPKSNIDARTELLAAMLALSKLEDTIAADAGYVFFTPDEAEALSSKAGELRRLVFKVYSLKETMAK